MSFRLDYTGPQIFTLTQSNTAPSGPLDPSVLFHADFQGCKIVKLQQNIVRTAGFSMGSSASTFGYTFYSISHIMLPKTYTVAPLIWVSGYDNFHGKWLMESYFEQHDSGGTSAQTYGIQIGLASRSTPSVATTSPSYDQLNHPIDRLSLETYDFDGTLNIYIVDGP